MSRFRVRMYRLGGIGDCFLLSFFQGDGSSHMLIDCGVLKGTEDMAALQAAVDDIMESTSGFLDVLAVTHEHWDHVSGFLQAKSKFVRPGFKVGQVWLAWTEDPQNALAGGLRERKFKARRAVDQARQKLRLSVAPGAADRLAILDGLSLFGGDMAATGARGTAAAMAFVRDELGSPVSYLVPGCDPVAIPRTAGVHAFVLGPPTDTSLLRRSDPSKRASEVYQLTGALEPGFLAAVAEEGLEDTGRPFDRFIPGTNADHAGQDPFFREHYYNADDRRKIDLDWLDAAEVLALQLDADTNNTSLALAIELAAEGPVLLFPGDAQVGNWLSWEPLKWAIRNPGGIRTVTGPDLLARTVLYKVGHHGSHNGTLREKGLELMHSPELAVMLPVYTEQARRQGKSGWAMPFGALLNRLGEQSAGRVLRSDQALPPGLDFGRRATASESHLYIDYLIDL